MIKDVFSYKLTIYPLSMVSPDQMLMETAKCKLMQHLEEDIPSLATHLMNCCNYDGLTPLQKLPTQLATFGDVSNYLLKKVAANTHRISFFVSNQYDQFSIKSLKRKKRLKLTRGNQKSQFKKFLAYKVDLVRFLIENWSTNSSY